MGGMIDQEEQDGVVPFFSSDEDLMAQSGGSALGSIPDSDEKPVEQGSTEDSENRADQGMGERVKARQASALGNIDDTANAPPPDPQKQFHDTLHSFDVGKNKINAAMAALDPNDPDYLKSVAKLQEQSGLMDLGKQKLLRDNPWGTPGNHPGTGGKIGHALGRIGNIAGDIFMPATMASIPGTDLNREKQINTANNEIAAGQKGSAEANTQVGKTPDEQAIHDLMAGNNGTPRINSKTGKPYTYLEAYTDVKQAAQDVKPEKEGTPEQQLISAKQELRSATTSEAKAAAQSKIDDITAAINSKAPQPSQEQNKLSYQTVIGKLDKAGLSTDPKEIGKSLDAAQKSGIITADEHAAAKGYQSANPNAATQITIHTEQAADARTQALRGKTVSVNTAKGPIQMSGEEAVAHGYNDFEVLTPQQAQKNKDDSANTVQTVKEFDRYHKDFNELHDKLTGADLDAFKYLAAHQKEASSSLGDIIDQIPAIGPIGEYATKQVKGDITKEMYDQMSPEGKKLMAEYYTTVMANLVNMKQTLGTVGRNPAMIEAEMRLVPLPYLNPDEANPAFSDKREDIIGRTKGKPRVSGQDYAGDVEAYNPDKFVQKGEKPSIPGKASANKKNEEKENPGGLEGGLMKLRDKLNQKPARDSLLNRFLQHE